MAWNPYLEEYLAGEGWDPLWERMRQGRNGGKAYISPTDYHFKREVDRTLSIHVLRRVLTANYAFAIPDEDALVAIAKYAPIIEMGAGTGYWARCLRERGVDVVAYDLMGEDWERWFRPKRLGEPREVGDLRVAMDEDDPTKAAPERWTEIERGDVEALDAHPDRTLLLVWPDYSTDFANRALHRYRGQHVVYVGEGQGGCTANDRFHLALERRWEEIEEVAIPQWWGLHDHLWIYRRKPRRGTSS